MSARTEGEWSITFEGEEGVMRITRVVLFVVLLTLALPVVAQEGPPPLPGEPVVMDLGAPRGIAFDADGNLLVADAGTGGEVEVTMAGPEGEAPAHIGLSGRIVSVAPDGTVSDRIAGFPSYAMATETMGVYRAIPQGDSLWVIYSGSGAATTGAFWMDSVVEYDAATLAVKTVINLNDFEATHDPDGNGYDTNVADIAWTADGTLLIVNAGMNALLAWTEADGLSVVTAWPDNSVPTSVEVAENGDVYVGFLGAGIAPGAGKVERWSGGALAETFGGLTGVTDILLAGDTLYAVQLFEMGAEGPGPGSVVSLTADGAEVVVGGLLAPFGIAMGPDGALYVSFGTIAFFEGAPAGVVRVPMM